MCALTRTVHPAALVLLLLALGCSHTRIVTMNAMRPADVFVPNHIQTVLVVDRTEIAAPDAGIVESVLTGELPGQDEAAVQAGIRALRDTLGGSGRFDVLVAAERLPGNSLTLALPAPLRWEQVERLARDFEVDAVLAVELFDSDFVVTGGVEDVVETIIENGRSQEVTIPEFYASGVCDVRMGVRLYDPVDRTILDEMVYPYTDSWRAVGRTPQQALEILIDNADATVAASEGAAVDYARRIAPSTVRIQRKFYARSKKVPAMERGSRLADVGSWDEAARTWEAAIPSAPSKEAGQLAYNVAVAQEVLGDFDAAVASARRAYVDYGLGEGLDYVEKLRWRASEESVLQAQLR